jgi:hypothetical protein
MKWVKRVLLALLVVLVAGQLVRPNVSAPPVDPAHTLAASTTVPPNIAAVFERSCIDCHSYKTTWPWYSRVFPVNWLLYRDVTQGRREVNFSEWATYSKRRKLRKLTEICEQVNKREMPLKLYLPLHPQAKLTNAERDAICEWANAEKTRVNASTTKN